MSQTIQVWCDIGGTFTDCFVVNSQNQRLSRKVLSHGRMPGTIERWTDNRSWIDSRRIGETDRFWVSSQIVFYDANRQAIGQGVCTDSCSTTGTIQFDGPEMLRDAVGYEFAAGVQAPVLAARLMLGVPLAQSLPPLDVRLGTTRATNALLTRTGEPTALVTTRGFEDLIEIGYQERPELFAIRVEKRPKLYQCAVGISERIDANGNILVSLDERQAREQLETLRARGLRSLAICLLHSYRNPSHELRVAQIAEQIGFEWIFTSSIVAPVIRAVSRGETTLVDAYLTPVVRRYLQGVEQQICSQAGSKLRVMTSSGGLVYAAEASGKELVLSGPAGGAVALQAISEQFNAPKLIGLDMGGTSTDVCRIDGRMQLEHETIKAGIRMSVPTLAIHTVASGGGSICYFDGVQLRVGPNSAGSDPGPACYGRGGPLTITDLNLLEGRIDPGAFPIPLNPQASQERLAELLAEVRRNVLFKNIEPMQLVSGLRRIANEQMASAVRAISIQQGADPREHTLVGFGGAAGQHICQIAELLEMERIIDHPQAGLLSALGIGLAQIKRSMSHPIYQPLKSIDTNQLLQIRAQLTEQLRSQLLGEGIPLSQQSFRGEIELRYLGSEGTLRLDWENQPEHWASEFERKYFEKFGVVRKSHPLELTNVWLEATSPRSDLNRDPAPDPNSENSPIPSSGHSNRTIQMTIGSTTMETPCLDRRSIPRDSTIRGPALIQSSGSTTIIDPGWCAHWLPDGSLQIDRAKNLIETLQPTDSNESLDPILREVIAQRIAAIADQMGIVLEQTALSVNVKQRRDFSCAVFDGRGELIANAPHVPVHLGAMGKTVQAMIERFASMQPGDCFVTNDPYQGGSHLPDVTVVTPVFPKQGASKPAFFVASRAHHAEIGGIAPGSMAPTSTQLGQEGVIIPPMHLTYRGIDRSEEIESLLRNSPYPSRNVPENMADLLAQQAANQRGVAAMQDLAESLGVTRLQNILESILEVAKAKTLRWIDSLADKKYRFEDSMDDGTPIVVQITKETKKTSIATDNSPTNETRLVFDFHGSGRESQGNLNANPGIVTAAVMYTIRCAIGDTMPLNSGVMRAVDLKIPQGILNPQGTGPKESWPAVAGGNVETSQRIVDVLWGALGLAAASQGTMNNFLFGNSRFGYYETIGGGTGANNNGPGADAVHSHMTNTRLTDVEVLESRYPVRLVQFGIRRGSGGDGHYQGGCGMIREIMALESLEVSLVTNRRSGLGPFGLQGGQHGALGQNAWIDDQGNQTELQGACQLHLKPGQSIRIMTPGGGGFGTPEL